jgi:hypothetical protein
VDLSHSAPTIAAISASISLATTAASAIDTRVARRPPERNAVTSLLNARRR